MTLISFSRQLESLLQKEHIQASEDIPKIQSILQSPQKTTETAILALQQIGQCFSRETCERRPTLVATIRNLIQKEQLIIELAANALAPITTDLNFGYQRSLELLNMNDSTQLLSTFGIACPERTASPTEFIVLITRTKDRVDQINQSLPENLRFTGPLANLVLNARKLKLFLQKAYNYQLCLTLGESAHIPLNTPFEDSVDAIRKWLQTPDAKNVDTLQLSNRNLFCLPKEVCLLTGLRVLELSKNHLTYLPPEIGNLDNLKDLQLESNQLTSLPPTIKNVTALSILDLSDNKLISIPSGIGGLRALQQLNLYGNPLSSVPTEIAALPTLKTLQISPDQTPFLPSPIRNLSSLSSFAPKFFSP